MGCEPQRDHYTQLCHFRDSRKASKVAAGVSRRLSSMLSQSGAVQVGTGQESGRGLAYNVSTQSYLLHILSDR